MHRYLVAKEPGSFGGADKLRRYSSQPSKDVSRWLMGQDAYTLHRLVRNRFRRRRTYAKGINDLFQADLVDMSAMARQNDGNRYLLTCIDVFSKRAWAVPLKNKSGETVKAAFEDIFKDEIPNMLQTDKGTEFLNSTVQALFAQHNIKHYTSENEDIKAAVVERFNRTLKNKMWRYFTYAKTQKYIDVLDEMIESYNNTYHRSIGMAPNEVTLDNMQTVVERLYPIKQKPVYKFEIGDKVRMSMGKRVFKRGYMQGWTDEIFTVSERYPTDPATYGVRDYGGEDIKGKFYAQELQKVTKADDVYEVEEVVKTRKRAGRVEYFVKWKGYPSKFNSWVDAVTTK